MTECDCRCHLPYVDQGAFVDWFPAAGHDCCGAPFLNRDAPERIEQATAAPGEFR